MKELHHALPATRFQAREPDPEPAPPDLKLKIPLPLLSKTLGLTLGGNNGNKPGSSPSTPAPAPPPSTPPAPAPAPTPSAPVTTTPPAPSQTTDSPAPTTDNTQLPTRPDPRPNNDPDFSTSSTSNGGASSTSGSQASPTSGVPSPGGTDSDEGEAVDGNTPSVDGQHGSGNSNGGGLNGAGQRPSPNNLGSDEFPDQSLGEGGSAGNGGSSNVGGGQAIGGSPSGSTVTNGRGGSPTLNGDGSQPTDIDDGGLPADDAGSRGGFPTGAGIAIGIICAILFLIGLVILLRRHRKAKREERVHHWWFSKKRNSRSYKDDTHVVQLPPPSARSSFVTTYDQSAQFEVNFNANMPALPPMAELRRSRNGLDYPMAPSTDSGHGHDKRFSIGSGGSHDSQFFIINHRQSMDTSNNHSTTDDHTMPATFSSPSQRFAFPKPPSDTSSDRKSGYSGSSSRPLTAVSRSGTSAKTYGTPDTSPTPPEHLHLPALAQNPFADPNAGAYAAVPAPPRSDASHETSTTDPFSDSTVSMAHGTVESEVVPISVLKPFEATLHDEVSLRPGEQVRVLQIFDDGWALVDKLESLSSPVPVQRGLCPVACLR